MSDVYSSFQNDDFELHERLKRILYKLHNNKQMVSWNL